MRTFEPSGNTASTVEGGSPAFSEPPAEIAKTKLAQGKHPTQSNASGELGGREAELRQLVLGASIGLHWVGEDGIIQWANEADYQMLGYSADEYIGRHIGEFHVDQAVFRDLLARLKQGERLRNYEARLRCKDGSLKTVLIDSSVLWEEDRFVHTQCFTRDVTPQKQAQEHLRLYQEIFEASKDAIAIIDSEGKYREQNEAHRLLFGYTDSQLQGQTPAMHLGEECFVQVAEALTREGRFRGEVVSRTSDGRELDIELSAFSVRDEAGRLLCHVGIKRDITERKRAEKALARRVREQAVLYEFTNQLHRAGALGQVYEAALDAIREALGCQRASVLISDEAGTMRFVAWRGLSESYRKAVEGHSPWRPEELDPQPVCIQDIRHATLSASLKSVVEAEGIGALAFIPLAGKAGLLGKVMLYYDAPHQFSTDDLGLSLTIARQLTLGIDRKRAEEATRRLAAIVESSEDAIISQDLDGTIMSWNQGAERLFGYTAEEVVGRPIHLLIPPERAQEEPGLLKRIRNGGAMDNYETVRRRKDGSLLDVSLTISPVKDSQGRVVGISRIARDITEKRLAKEHLERVVAERTGQLRETVAELEAFSYSIAHDMRAPLRSMHSYARLLEEEFGQGLPEDGRHYLSRIANAAGRLDTLITDVLNYSRIARGELPLEAVDLEKLARDIIDSYASLRDSGATMLVQPPIPCVIGNAAALTQCLSNLLSNAVKFVRPGTRPRVVLRGEVRSPVVRLWIEDNGIGISEEGQRRLFRLFQRLNPSREFEGTGIGLTIVRKAVERMGGRVGVESQVGQGSRFWLELPQAD